MVDLLCWSYRTGRSSLRSDTSEPAAPFVLSSANLPLHQQLRRLAPQQVPYSSVHRRITLVYTSITLTIRTDEALRKALEEQAKARKKTVSQLAREILARALTERPFAERVGHLRGQLGRWVVRG